MNKSTAISLCAGIALILVTLIVACDTGEKRTMTEYTLLVDQTDSGFAVPDTADIFADMGIAANTWSGVAFSLSRIKDVSYTRHTVISLAKGPARLSGNQYARKREVERFKEQVSTALDSIRKEHTGKPNSSVFVPIANELTRLANSGSGRDRKVLVVVSDLMEHTTTMNFYTANTVSLLKTNPDSIERKLLALAQLPENLSGIEVRLINEPKNASEDALYQIVSGFYRTLLTKRGATVSVSGSVGNH